MLKAGSSEYSLELLQKGGVDMNTSQPIDEALEVFKKLLDEFELLL